MNMNKAAGLSRLKYYLDNYEVACISAEKYLPDRQQFDSQHEFETACKNLIGQQKKWDAKALRIQLWAKYSGVVKIKGFYKYNNETSPSKEQSFLVANLSNDTNFKKDILDLAVKCKQNSIFYAPKDYTGYWIYTGIDLAEDDEVDKQHNYGDISKQVRIHLGKKYENSSGETSYSEINSRPFSAYDTVIDERLNSNYARCITQQEGLYMKMFTYTEE